MQKGTVSRTACLLLVASMFLLPGIQPVRSEMTQNSFGVVSSWNDPEDLSVAPYLDILNITVEFDGFTLLRFNMTLRGSLPDSHLFVNKTVDDNLSYAWWIDADRNSATGQRHQYVGSEYNIMFQASGGSPTGEWGARVDITAPGYSGGGSVQFTIKDNKISLLAGLSQIGESNVFDWSATTWGRLYGSSLGSNPETIKQTANVQETPGNSNVIITPLTLTLRDGVTTGKVKAILTDENGAALAPESLSITYVSDNPSVGVDLQGNVDAQGFGVAHIRAIINGASSADYATVNFGRLSIRPSILLLSTQSNRSASLGVDVENADGSKPQDSSLHVTFWVSGGSTEVATVASNGTVTAHRPPTTFGETPYVSAAVNGITAHSSAVIRVTNTDTGLAETEYRGTYISFYSPLANGRMNYNKTIYDNQMVRITDLAYALMREATAVTPLSGDTQFLVADPGHADGTVPYGLGGNPIRLGVDLDTGNSGFIVNEGNPTPVWWVFFHEMGHSFLGEGLRLSQFLGASANGSFSYSEGLASVLGMYSAAMMQKDKDKFQIPSAILQTSTFLPTYHLSTTPDLDKYKLIKNYANLNPSVVYDIMLTVAQTYGFEKFVRFFATFLPPEKPFPFRIASDKEQATLFVAALSSAVGTDLKSTFVDLGFPIDGDLYAQFKNVTDEAAAFRDPNAQPGRNKTVKTGTLVQLDGNNSFDVLQPSLTYNWTIISKPQNSNTSLNAGNTATPTFMADAAGNYTISLTVGNGVLTSSSHEVTIFAKDILEPPIASFNHSPETLWVNEDAVFNSTPGCDAYVWNFGDGNVTSVSNPLITHAYSAVGKYTVILNVTEYGLWNSISSQITVTYGSDLNKDGKVNILDVSTIAKAFGSRPGDPNWNETADLDKNGQINIIDVTVVARDYGRTV